MLRFDQFKVLTFDCYGTLIDWESGILSAMRRAFSAHQRPFDPQKVLAAYAELEPQIQSGSYSPYRQVLAELMRGISGRFNVPFSPAEVDSLAESVADWLPYPDTVPALRLLKQKYQLAIISNIDDDLFAFSAQRLEVTFDFVITAQQAGSYKPSLQNFQLALARIGQPKEKILHVAESLFHDIAPASSLGLRTVWVNRRAGTGLGASKPACADPDMTVSDLRGLARLALAN